MDTFEKLLSELNLPHRKHNEKRTQQYNRYYNSFPIHPKLFIESVNKVDPPCKCALNTDIVKKALESNEMKKLEVYVLWAWMRSDNVLGTKYENYETEDKKLPYNIDLIRRCYDEVIRPAFEKHYPPKKIQNTDLNLKIDMKLKDAKFDVVYDNVYGGLNHDHLTNKYKHRQDLKKKFLYGEVQPNGSGKIDYQLALFTRLFEVEMTLMMKT
eukprot:SAG31_NODE_7799_length_1594_cov_1.967893_1_plen_212_part_00